MHGEQKKREKRIILHLPPYIYRCVCGKKIETKKKREIVKTKERQPKQKIVSASESERRRHKRRITQQQQKNTLQHRGLIQFAQ